VGAVFFLWWLLKCQQSKVTAMYCPLHEQPETNLLYLCAVNKDRLKQWELPLSSPCASSSIFSCRARFWRMYRPCPCAGKCRIKKKGAAVVVQRGLTGPRRRETAVAGEKQSLCQYLTKKTTRRALAGIAPVRPRKPWWSRAWSRLYRHRRFGPPCRWSGP